MIKRLKEKWKIEKNWQLFIILIIFSLAGSTTVIIKEPVFDLLGIDSSLFWGIRILLYISFVTPVYFIILMAYGIVFGQYRFFRNFIAKTFGRLKLSNREE